MNTFFSVLVGSTTQNFLAQNVLGVQSSGTTTVTIQYSGGTVLTLTTNNSASTVAANIRTSIVQSNSGGVYAPDRVFSVTIPSGTTVSAAAFSLLA